MISPRIRRSAWLLIALGAATVAWLGLRPRVPEPGPATADRLEAAAEVWWQPGEPRRQIPETEWPTELHGLGPETVTATPEGVYVQFGSFFVESWGLFILPRGSSFKPAAGTDPSFRHLRGRIYKYTIKG